MREHHCVQTSLHVRNGFWRRLDLNPLLLPPIRKKKSICNDLSLNQTFFYRGVRTFFFASGTSEAVRRRYRLRPTGNRQRSSKSPRLGRRVADLIRVALSWSIVIVGTQAKGDKQRVSIGEMKQKSARRGSTIDEEQ